MHVREVEEGGTSSKCDRAYPQLVFVHKGGVKGAVHAMAIGSFGLALGTDDLALDPCVGTTPCQVFTFCIGLGRMAGVGSRRR